MAKADWVRANPNGGTGNATVRVQATEYTGRIARETTLTWKAKDLPDIVRKVTQSGKKEYVTISNEEVAFNKTGGTIRIEGTSNSSKLKFYLGTNSSGGFTLPSNYDVGGKIVANDAVIEGDPGASGVYNFFIDITAASNPSVVEVTGQLVIEDNAGNKQYCNLRIAAGDAYLTVPEGDINFTCDGGTIEVYIESNTGWSIS